MNTGAEKLSYVEPSDPDYESMHVDRFGEINESLHREDARDQTVQRIQKIVHEQFSFEIELKEKEVTTINRRVHETRNQLDRLRSCILAGYYGYGKSSESLHQDNLNRGRRRGGKSRSKETCLNDVMKWKQSLPSNLKENPVKENLAYKSEGHLGTGDINGGNHGMPQSNHEQNTPHRGSTFSPTTSLSINLSAPEVFRTSKSASESESRFYIKRRVIVGNTSKYILPEHRERNDRSTHKWMVYVRGPKDNSELQSFISKVWFLLHPSYQPNDLVEVCKPPFQVTRRGWGEFPVRVQLHFVDNKNKRVDIIHHLKLDKTFTGLQTLGAETHVDIELDRKNFDCKSSLSESLLLPVAASSNRTETNVPSRQTEAIDSNANKIQLLLELENHQMNDHSYSAPTKKLRAVPCDEDLKYPTPPTSVPGSRSSSPQTTKEILSKTLGYENEVNLRKSVKHFPLVNPNHNVILSPYCASTLNQHLGWNIGKRLAAEWQRSLAIKKHVYASHSISNLSTKDIMNYCRFHGYTPMPTVSAEGKSLCKVCGEEKGEPKQDSEHETAICNSIHDCCDVNSESLGSLSSAEEFVNLLEASNSLPTKPDIEQDDTLESGDIDVVTVTEEQSVKQKVSSGLLFLPMNEELEWVQETASEVDVHLRGINVDGVRVPVTVAMLHKACGLLVEDILRKANQFTWKTPSRIPRTNCILPTHIQKAIDVIPHCDFLTNKYLGVIKPEAKD